MVGLVIVSHSAKLAEGVVELVRGVGGPEVLIAAAGGMDLPGEPLGTDANRIHQAIQRVYSPDGVVLLVDLGSAILASEMALEMLEPSQREHVAISPAPLVEGAIAAAAQARLGLSLDAVMAEARTTFDAKLSQLGGTPEPSKQDLVPQAPSDTEPTLTLTLTVQNRLGLHVRPAAKLVQTAARFEANIQVEDVTSGRGPANAKSITAVTTLGVVKGHVVKLTARGTDAQTALDALGALADENFGEVETATRSEETRTESVPPAGSANELAGLAASPGIGLGLARLYRPPLLTIPQHTSENPEREWARLSDAIHRALLELEQARFAMNARGQAAEAEIFDAQALLLRDPALLDPVRQAIYEQHANAARAFDAALTAIAGRYDALENAYQRARAEDVRAVARLVLLNLEGERMTVRVAEGVLVAPDLTPAETAQLDPKWVSAICTAFGGPTGHSAILAKSLGIPAVVGLGEKILQVEAGTLLLVDGTHGRVWVNPASELVEEYTGRIESGRAAADLAHALRHDPAVTRDGRRIEIAANINAVPEAKKAVELGADAVGLFRTEFLFANRPDAPGEDEQYKAYRAVAQTLEGRSLVIRTLDAGADKPLPYLNMPYEANPFLGLRGLRLCLAQPELFKTQLRAILRVAVDFPVRMMFPMVSVIREFREAQALVNQARIELTARGVTPPPAVETGIMVEVPAAALAAAEFAREVDFFSIGTNDLAQYLFAAERGNSQVAALADPFHPSVLDLVSKVVKAAHAHGKWVGVCGEMAGDPRAIPILVALGVDELSMAPHLIPGAKQSVREINLADAE